MKCKVKATMEMIEGFTIEVKCIFFRSSLLAEISYLPCSAALHKAGGYILGLSLTLMEVEYNMSACAL